MFLAGKTLVESFDALSLINYSWAGPRGLYYYYYFYIYTTILSTSPQFSSPSLIAIEALSSCSLLLIPYSSHSRNIAAILTSPVMCRQYIICYEWCRCEFDAGNFICTARKEGTCQDVAIEAAHMHCFCNRHAKSSWKSERRIRRRARKLKKRGTDPDEKGVISTVMKRKKRWYHWFR